MSDVFLLSTPQDALLVIVKSLMPACLFNIIGFGSTFKTLFPASQTYCEVGERETHFLGARRALMQVLTILLLPWAGELGHRLREHQEDPGRYGWHQHLITFEVGHSAAHPQGPSPSALSADGWGHQQHGEGPGAAAKPLLFHQVGRAAGLGTAGAKAWHVGGRNSP